MQNYSQYKLPNGKLLNVETESEAEDILTQMQDASRVPNKFFSFVKSSSPLMNQTVIDINYLTMNVTIEREGDYRLDVSYLWSLNSTGVDINVTVKVDGTSVYDHREEPQDSGGTGQSVPSQVGVSTDTGTDQRRPVAFFDILEGLSVGSHVIEMDFRGTANLQEATIYQAAMSLEEK